jgi:uncharacterized protein (DUF2141 family)
MNSAAAVLLLAMLATSAQATALTITVDEIRSAKGDIRLSLYASPAEWPDKSTKDHDFVTKARADRVVFRLDVPPGTYAVNGFHDENGNGKFDTSLVGLPEEGYFFSNNDRPLLLAPGFDAARFNVPPEGRAITVHVVY